ncbi:unnamed protein product [Caenorhabditis bovis]|uniref:Glutaredoxin domain-containing protein n=1 Tax=Caenorhabditis bovis TaxID=2654633 RepID=A0A8S1EMY9_9PELO|nr:unnamed protein product [Caenorhabditis bovis]
MLDIASIESFLERYGWPITFFTIAVCYVWNKFIRDVVAEQNEERKREEQQRFNEAVAEKEAERIRLVREAQQNQYNEIEAKEKIKRELLEKERLEKLLKEYGDQDNRVGYLDKKLKEKLPQDNEKRSPQQILDNFIASKPIVVFTKSFCPFSRKVKQLIATYKFDRSVYEFVDLDDPEENLPADEIQQILEAKYGRKAVPQMFVNGDYVGGLEEIQQLSRDNSFEKFLQ